MESGSGREPGSQGAGLAQGARWGGCRDPRPGAIFGTGRAPVGVPVAANGWRCPDGFRFTIPSERGEIVKLGGINN